MLTINGSHLVMEWVCHAVRVNMGALSYSHNFFVGNIEDCILGLDILTVYGIVVDFTAGLLQGDFGIAQLLREQMDTLSVRTCEAELLVGEPCIHLAMHQAENLHAHACHLSRRPCRISSSRYCKWVEECGYHCEPDHSSKSSVQSTHSEHPPISSRPSDLIILLDRSFSGHMSQRQLPITGKVDQVTVAMEAPSPWCFAYDPAPCCGKESTSLPPT